MFTGIVEELGTLKSIQRGTKSAKLVVNAQEVLIDAKIGDSIAVNGVCLTVTEFTGQGFGADIMFETLQKSNLGDLRSGDKVNLERAMKLSDRLGGHLVSGHIDGVGTIINQATVDIAVVTKIKAPPEVLKYVINKGSVAIDGISLTVVAVSEDDFSVSLIPHTAKITTLGFKKLGDKVNLEGDVVGKYIERIMNFNQKKASQSDKESKLDWDFLTKHGF